MSSVNTMTPAQLLALKKSKYSDEKDLLVNFRIERKLYNACCAFCKKNNISKDMFFSICLMEILSDEACDVSIDVKELDEEPFDASELKDPLGMRFEFETIYCRKTAM